MAAATLQELPDAATSYAAANATRTRRLTAGAVRLWRTVGDDFADDFLRIAPALIAATNDAQFETALAAERFIPSVLYATGQAEYDKPAFAIGARQWVGTAGDGLPTESLLYGTVTRAKTAVSGGASVAQAIDAGAHFLDTALRTLLADTARGAEHAATNARPVTGYVRMLTPPSCGRCVILAGKRVNSNTAFQRHPGCDCRHIPAAEDLAGELTTNPDTYLASLSDDALRKALGSEANAKAFRQYGANTGQLVNAYRRKGWVRPGQIYGKRIRYTLEGTSVRGVASHQMRRVRQLSELAKQGGRYRRVTAPRLMPESIFAIATSDEHARKLLVDHGWLGITRN